MRDVLVLCKHFSSEFAAVTADAGLLWWGLTWSFGRANARSAPRGFKLAAYLVLAYAKDLMHEPRSARPQPSRARPKMRLVKTRAQLSSVLNIASRARINLSKTLLRRSRTAPGTHCPAARAATASYASWTLSPRKSARGRSRDIPQRCTASKCQPSSPATTRTNH